MERNDSAAAGKEIAGALCDFRDALVNLSLLLKDWTFEHDQSGRQAAEQAACQLVEKIK